MNRFEAMRAAFNDEMSKIAGEMHGFTRIGRRPIGVERLIERDGDRGPTDVLGLEEGVKLSAVPYQSALKVLAPMAAGAGVYAMGRRMNEDRKMGRAMRMQQGFGQ